MKIWHHNTLDSQRDVTEIAAGSILIGSDPQCDIVLQSPYVADRAATFELEGDECLLRVLGRNGCKVDDESVAAGQVRTIYPTNRIEFFPFLLSLDSPTAASEDSSEEQAELAQRMSALIRAVHIHLISTMDVEGNDDQRRENDAYMLRLERTIDEIARINDLEVSQSPEFVDHVAGEAIRAMLIGDLIQQCESRTGAALFDEARGWSRIVSAAPEREREAELMVERLKSDLKLSDDGDLSHAMAVIDRELHSRWQTMLTEILPDFRLYLARREVKKQIKDIVFGYGPLEDLLRIPTISEIMVVNKDAIYVEKNGVVERSGRRFISDDVTKTIINRITSRVGRSVDKSRPLVDARLIDGSRVNAVVPPLAVSGPCLTIRKFPADRFRMDRLVGEKGSLTNEAAEFLRAAVRARKNILISGGTGTGKTTLLNCLSDCIGEKERIVTIEDTAELQLEHEHVVRLETKHKNSEGGGAYTIRDLVKNSLRMRPDRIVVGECRGGEALDMLQAMNTGHDGSLTTVHANNPDDVVRRLEVMAQSSGVSLTMDSIHSQISSAIDLVVQLKRFRNGRRVVSHITEVLPQNRNESGVRTRDLFVLKGDPARLTPTGRLPTYIDDLITSGEMQLELMYG